MGSQTTEFINHFIENFPGYSSYVKGVRRGIRLNSENVHHMKQFPGILIHNPSMTGSSNERYSALNEFFVEPIIQLKLYVRDGHDHFGGSALEKVELITFELWKFLCTYSNESSLIPSKSTSFDGISFNQTAIDLDFASDVKFSDNIKSLFITEATFEITLKNLQIKASDIESQITEADIESTS